MTVRERLQRERAGLRAQVLAAGGGVAVAAAAFVLALGALALGGARWIRLPAFAPFVVWGLVIVAAVAALGWTVARLRRSTHPGELAAAVERERALRAGSLRGVLEVAGSSALARRAEERLLAQLGATRGPLAPELRSRLLRQGLFAAGGVALAALVTGGLAVRDPDGWRAVAHPVRAFEGTLLPPLVLEDAPESVLRGEPLTITVHAPARREIVLRWRTTGAGWRESRQPVVDERARVALGEVDADLQIVAFDGRAASDTAIVRVADRPFLGDVSVRAFYPTYLGRPPETLALGEPARVPRGTLLEIRGGASTTLREVALVRDSSTEVVRLAVDGRRFSGRVPVSGGGRWTWSARGQGGPIAELPPPLELEVLADSAPVARILAPAADTTVLPGDRVSLALSASDDHGVGQVLLRSWRVRAGGRREGEEARLVAAPDLPLWEDTTELALEGFALQPGDAVHLVLVAVDESPWRQAGESEELVLRVPRLNEQRELARGAADSLVQRAREAAARQQALARRTDEAARSRDRRSGGSGRSGGTEGGGSSGGGSAMSYESAERAKQLAREQRELAAQVEQMQRSAQQLERQLRQAGALDPELQARLREAQRLMQEALTPELARKLAELEQSAQGLNEEQTRQALGDLAAQQRRMREQLERSVEMLRRAALEGSMETLRDEAEELAQEQRRLSDSLSRGRAGERDAQDLAQRSRQLAQDVKRLQERLAEQRATQGAQRTGQAAERAEASAERMREAAERAARAAGDLASAQRQQGGEQPQSRPSPGERAGGQPQGQRAGQQQAGERNAGGQQGGQQQAGTRAEEGGAEQRGAEQGGAQGPARQAAEAMDEAAQQLAAARQEQVAAWKSELTSELDRAINEMQQLAREQQRLEQQAREGADAEELRSGQSAVQQGVRQAGQRLQEQGQRSTHLSQRSQAALAEAERRVAQAAQAAAQGGAGEQTASAMRGASESLTQLAASLVRDRDRVNSASSASGFSDMIREMQQLAQQQGALNQQAQGLLPSGRRGLGDQAREAARQLARQQRGIAERLEELGDSEGAGAARAEAMAEEARQLARALEQGTVDPSVVNRQQRLFRRMLDAGRTLEQDERDESGRREARAALSPERFAPPETPARGREAARYRVPTWNELRALSPEERRLVLEYFRRLNAEP